MTYKRAGHLIRWILEFIILLSFVLPETGPWTTFVLLMITVGLEWDYLTGRR
jgi:hypothetical protein